MIRTKTQQRIVEAYERGYRMQDGTLHSIKGEVQVKLYGAQRYPTFSTNWGGFVYALPVHQFAAYQCYGEASFEEDNVVRHLDGNVLNLSEENIKLGTRSDNEKDKPIEVRKRVARIARASQGPSPRAKLSDAAVLLVRDPASGTAKELAEQLGVVPAVIYNVRKGATYAHVQ